MLTAPVAIHAFPGNCAFHISACGRKWAAIPNAEFLALPFVLSFFIIGGLRFVFEVPAELRANGVHQVIVDVDSHQAASVARKVMLTGELTLRARLRTDR